MRNQQSVQPITDHFSEAKTEWHHLGTGDEGAMTLRSICTVVRLSLKPNLDPEEISDLCWLLRVGAVISDLHTYNPQTT